MTSWGNVVTLAAAMSACEGAKEWQQVGSHQWDPTIGWKSWWLNMINQYDGIWFRISCFLLGVFNHFDRTYLVFGTHQLLLLPWSGDSSGWWCEKEVTRYYLALKGIVNIHDERVPIRPFFGDEAWVYHHWLDVRKIYIVGAAWLRQRHFEQAATVLIKKRYSNFCTERFFTTIWLAL